MCAFVFLARNGLRLDANEISTVQMVTLLATGEIEESEFAAWPRENSESA